ncbi:hypothetical protein IAQ61_004100 [Plenodomus lingam]|nr:hypothetical protein IAQ61_004100 [Plenodomus lingam]
MLASVHGPVFGPTPPSSFPFPPISISHRPNLFSFGSQARGRETPTASRRDQRAPSNMSESAITEASPAQETAPVKGMKKNGKQWHGNKSAFRPRTNQTSWEKRTAERAALAAVKAKEKELKEEKESERQRRVDAIKTKRAAKAERERFALMEEKMHKKRVDRLKRREKRNKMLKS